jgi:hypothetical protein
MDDRRKIYVFIPRVDSHFPRDRRQWMDRRQHHGFTRILFADLTDLWNRFRT